MKRFLQCLKAICVSLGIVNFCSAQEPAPRSPIPSPQANIRVPLESGSASDIAAEIERQERLLAQNPDDKIQAGIVYRLYLQKGWRDFWGRQDDAAQQSHQKARVIDQKYKIYKDGIGTKLITPSDIFWRKGWEQMAKSEYPAALQAYQDAIRLDPTSTAAQYELGRLFIALKQKENAENQLQILRRLDNHFGALDDCLAREILRAFPASTETEPNAAAEQVFPASRDLKPKVLYQEKAKYTEAARQYSVQGTVVVSVVFQADGQLTNLKIIRALPLGLAETAIEAAQKIRFSPAMKDGKPVSTRMMIEFTFNLL
jgi:TonB family protein